MITRRGFIAGLFATPIAVRIRTLPLARTLRSAVQFEPYISYFRWTPGPTAIDWRYATHIANVETS